MSEHKNLDEIRGKLKEVRELIKDSNTSIFDDLPHDIRYDLLNLACSLNDYIFWVKEIEEGKYRCHEIETGMYAHGKTPQEAMDDYFAPLKERMERNG